MAYTLDTSTPKAQRAGHAARRVASAPSRAAKATTSYSGEKVLAAELLVAFVIVAIRVVADYESQEDGTATGKVLHPAGQLGPLPILAGLIITFFVLSFAAAGGGTRAKLAVILGGAIVLTLGVKSYKEIQTVGTTVGRIGTIVIPAATGSEGSGASGTNTLGSGSSGSSSGGGGQKVGKNATPTQRAGVAASNANQAAINAAKADAAALQHLDLNGILSNTFKLSIDGMVAGVEDARNGVSAGLKDATNWIKGLFG